jgi:Tfp pilus assembly protein PilF
MFSKFFVGGASDEPFEAIPFPGFCRGEWINLLVAGLLSILAFLAYATCISDVPLPGASASTLAQISGVSPNLISRHFAWRWMLQQTMACRGGVGVYAANMTSAFFGAAAVGLMYLVAYGFMALPICVFGLSPVFEDDTIETSRVATVAGVFSSLGLAVQVPFWFSATQVYPYCFYLCWMLLGLYLMLRYLALGSKISLVLFSLLWGVGMGQTGAFIGLSPFLLLLIAKWRSIHNRRQLWVLLAILALFAVGSAFLLLDTYMFRHSEGYALLNYPRYAAFVKNAVVALLGDMAGCFRESGWLIVLTTSGLPFVSMLFLFRRSTDAHGSKGILFFNAALLLLTLSSILDLKISAWSILGESMLRMMPMAMTAVVFGYSTAVFFFRLRHWQQAYVPEDSAFNLGATRRSRALGWIFLLGFMVGVLALGVARNFSKVDNRQLAFLKTYVDSILDEVTPEQYWIVTDGSFDDVLLLRASERGLRLRTIDVTVPRTHEVYYRMLKGYLTDEALRRVLDLGVVTFVQEWVETRPTATHELLLTVFPDIWVLGGYEVISNGFVFRGIESERYDSYDTGGLVERFTNHAEVLRAQLNDADHSKSQTIRRLARRIRSLSSLNGNNLGYMLDRQGKKGEAADVYALTCWFDQNNVSALLNHAALVLSLPDSLEEEKRDVRRRLDSVPENLRNLPAVVLNAAYGYLRWTGAIARTGVDWAVIGNDSLSFNLLGQALESGGLTSDQVEALRKIMAAVAIRQGDFKKARQIYTELLDRQNLNPDVLVGLLAVEILSGDYKAAERRLSQFRSSGAPSDIVLQKSAELNLAMGNHDQALRDATQLRALVPGSAEACVLACEILINMYQAATDQEQKASHMEKMNAAYNELVYLLGANDLRLLILRGKMDLASGELESARIAFLRAAGMASDSRYLLEIALQVDFSLGDKKGAEVRANQILRRDTQNKFANYVLALISFDDGRLDDAEHYLSRSLSSGTFPEGIRLREKLGMARAEDAMSSPEH